MPTFIHAQRHEQQGADGDEDTREVRRDGTIVDRRDGEEAGAGDRNRYPADDHPEPFADGAIGGNARDRSGHDDDDDEDLGSCHPYPPTTNTFDAPRHFSESAAIGETATVARLPESIGIDSMQRESTEYFCTVDDIGLSAGPTLHRGGNVAERMIEANGVALCTEPSVTRPTLRSLS